MRKRYTFWVDPGILEVIEAFKRATGQSPSKICEAALRSASSDENLLCFPLYLFKLSAKSRPLQKTQITLSPQQSNILTRIADSRTQELSIDDELAPRVTRNHVFEEVILRFAFRRKLNNGTIGYSESNRPIQVTEELRRYIGKVNLNSAELKEAWERAKKEANPN